MILIKQGQINKLVVTCTQTQSASTPKFYLFSFEHIITKNKVRFYARQLLTNDRYDEFEINEITSTANNEDLFDGFVKFDNTGQYFYSIYEMPTETLNPNIARQKLEEGRANVYNDVNPVFFTPYISDNENNSNVVYYS